MNSRRQSMRNASYASTRKSYEPWKKNNAGRNTAQKTNTHNQGHLEVWVKKNGMLSRIKQTSAKKMDSIWKDKLEVFQRVKTLVHTEFMDMEDGIKGKS